ncbi:MAG TPA: peptide deformylase, partial [Patescibacteria group bacterium]|nr:peptide deformylase [Patescibacteria group bacterium]
MPKILKKTEFGNPILRSKLNKLSKSEILSKSTKVLLKNMYFTLENKKYGVGFAANQVGQDKSLCIIDTKPTP